MAETEETEQPVRPEQWTLYINGYDQGQISVVTLDSEAHMSVSEYCAYASYAEPIRDFKQKILSISTVKVPDTTP